MNNHHPQIVDLEAPKAPPMHVARNTKRPFRFRIWHLMVGCVALCLWDMGQWCKMAYAAEAWVPVCLSITAGTLFMWVMAAQRRPRVKLGDIHE